MSSAFLARWNETLLDENYDKWRRDPASVGTEWSSFFEGFELGFARYQKKGTVVADSAVSTGVASKPGEALFNVRVEELLNAYRTLGHSMATLNPLSEGYSRQSLVETAFKVAEADEGQGVDGAQKLSVHEVLDDSSTGATKSFAAPVEFEGSLLDISQFGFSEADLETMVSSASFRGGVSLSLRDLVKELRSIYCSTSTVEFMHIQDPAIRHWIRDRVEAPQGEDSKETSHYRILRTLHKAELFENFLHTTYVGSKRFSIEGGESLMVALTEILRRSPRHEIKEIVLGMAHRGRLNVLANFLKKPFAIIFNEFSEQYVPDIGEASGDVKYHLGYQTTRTNKKGESVEVILAANPSHLEAVNPVVMGKARARQRILGDTEHRRKVLPLLIHGDAAVIGQGIVAECLNLSQLPGYHVGGTLHLVVNNQIGFTTLPADSRSTTHCTDIAKFIEAPIFHLNGDDPLAVCKATRLALEFRQQFGRDVFLDIVCYRRYGHNEGDEPSFTQPDLYKIIKNHPRVSEVFLKKVLPLGTITETEVKESSEKTLQHLATALAEMKKGLAVSGYDKKATFVGSTAVFQPTYTFTPVKTALAPELLQKVVQGLTTIPSDFRIQAKVRKNVIEKRQEIFKAGGPYDWSFGEALAFGSLLMEGIPVRLSGQDSRRGTFSHRHSVFYDEVTRERFIPLSNLSSDQARFCVYNSPLSEASVLGFDYGYSMDYPKMLCLWEAQFGDFANGAQVIVDQFISAAETKWLRPSSLVMLLPHGYEGMGPEHSSARLERYLQLCAEENMEVCNLTTPAQYFHVLRRQMMREFRKPLIIMTPKSLLRAEAAVSKTEDFTQDGFHEIYPGPSQANPSDIERIILCSGKVYYDLLAYQQQKGWSDRSVIIRLEQLYPLHEEKLQSLVDSYPAKAKLVWCQEEPQNMGAYTYLLPRLQKLFSRPFLYAGREASASTAVGALSLHRIEQAKLVEEAFEEKTSEKN
ncbi:MAG: 2-oxoglutarate dehydrogenase E1 component [Verrucomicrobia bacterium RIFCSPHIGHO2_12_FULL_41_10]|nr:MAG: 2-oxoglutarate dehydrogenase E1 component [Verrucomicrobia bacterium RIFCSPHIGHO2_12_FULL_41_10]HLB33442.1 2-oxoglutarate dehydrogenase E1 component [Chthoniobacterales bacterium]